MKYWKTFAGQMIYRTENGIHVYNNFKYRWLTFANNNLQTLINLKKPFKPELNYINPLILCASNNPGPTCLLGLGGAAIAHALDKKMGEHKITAIEYNQDVIKIAEQYFMSKMINSLNIVHADAYLYMQNTNHHYQHILVDLFDTSIAASNLQNSEFFTNCRKHLLPNGILAVNIVNLEDCEIILQNIKQSFHIITMPVKKASNIIVLAYAGESINPLLDNLYYHKSIKKIQWDQKFGCIAW